MVEWKHSLDQKWAALHFGKIKVETRGEYHLFEVQVYFHNLDPKAVRVEIYADGDMNDAPVCKEMMLLRYLVGSSGGYVYCIAVPASRPSRDYTARLVPYCEGMAIPLEDDRILWQQ
jgi:starch phosphorylase